MERNFTSDTSNSSVANDSYLSFVLTTPAGDGTRVIVNPLKIWASGSLFETDFLSDVSSSGGTARASYSLDGAGISGCAILAGATIVDGTVGQHYLFGDSTNTGSYLECSAQEYFLTPGGKYAIRVTNKSGAVAPISISATWREVTHPGLRF